MVLTCSLTGNHRSDHQEAVCRPHNPKPFAESPPFWLRGWLKLSCLALCWFNKRNLELCPKHKEKERKTCSSPTNLMFSGIKRLKTSGFSILEGRGGFPWKRCRLSLKVIERQEGSFTQSKDFRDMCIWTWSKPWAAFERVTGRKARSLQMEEIGCKCQTFFVLSSRRRQTSVNFFPPSLAKSQTRLSDWTELNWYKFKRGFS